MIDNIHIVLFGLYSKQFMFASIWPTVLVSKVLFDLLNTHLQASLPL
ncbi:hypothetical protein PROFUN_14971 [Planoprotostelium fungivorum]|uniref:Uncharacterized protein n=1 Tax=Planoprotostelium fungivorum TaxID=1890364 RepID=A0A2P6MY69_9EUKA|nr:hypothetical protein PROFUN_14971 [Planoprotostelium fungivorum]